MKILKFVESAKKANFFDPKAGKEIKVSMRLLKLFVTRLLFWFIKRSMKELLCDFLVKP